MKIYCLSLFFIAAFFTRVNTQVIEVWKSSEDQKFLFTQDSLFFHPVLNVQHNQKKIEIKPQQTYQSILGIGASLDHATCYNLSRLDENLCHETIDRIANPETGIGMNLMRICIGTPDFTGESWYSYNDLPAGKTDTTLEHFSIARDQQYVIPIIKKFLEKNPDLLIFASPWSPPAWMKTNNSPLAGKLKPVYYEVYAQYLVKFIKAYKTEGIPIHAITIQNEPDYPDSRYPTCHWTAAEQKVFIRDYLGPLFTTEGIETKIWCWDHNWNKLDFPRILLRDLEVAKYIDGTAFHLYEGKVEAQTILHHEFPDKHIYFSEGSTFKTTGAIEIINILRNWSRSYNAWVLVLDEHQKPNKGPHHADPTPIERLDDNSLRFNFDYYMYGHFAKFIQRHAIRIYTNSEGNDFANIAFKNPDGSIVLIVTNSGYLEKTFSVVLDQRIFNERLKPRSLATYKWFENF